MTNRTHAYVETNGVKLHVVKEGPEEGKVVILLHGFPEFWYGWRKQMSFLAKKGYHVWVPDQRGYNLSSKPNKVNDYRIDKLVKDVADLIQVSKKDKVILVGHDWGGIVAWRFARTYPELLERLVILNAPHEEAMGRYTRTSMTQLLKSTYILFFQLRWVPEKVLSFHGFQALCQMFKKSSRKGTFSKEDLQKYREAWLQPKALPSMLNWYRANLRHLSDSDVPSRVTVPVLVIWGTEDQFLKTELAKKSMEFCEEGQLVFVEGATHWVHLEEPDRVNSLLLNFLS